jgi:hypothetical protein
MLFAIRLLRYEGVYYVGSSISKAIYKLRAVLDIDR